MKNLKKKIENSLSVLPALTPETAAALLRPCFLMMKLEPMKPLETNARVRPVRFSLDKPMSQNRKFLRNLDLFFFSFASSMSSETNTVPQIIIIIVVHFMIVECWKKIGCERPQPIILSTFNQGPHFINILKSLF